MKIVTFYRTASQMASRYPLWWGMLLWILVFFLFLLLGNFEEDNRALGGVGFSNFIVTKDQDSVIWPICRWLLSCFYSTMTYFLALSWLVLACSGSSVQASNYNLQGVYAEVEGTSITNMSGLSRVKTSSYFILNAQVVDDALAIILKECIS